MQQVSRRPLGIVDVFLGLLLMAAVGAMFYFSLVAPQDLTTWGPRLGLGAPGTIDFHARGYALLTMLLLLTFVWNPLRGRRVVPLVLSPLVVAVAIAVGFGIEVAQRVMGRDSEWRDVASNNKGVMFAFGVWLVLLLVTKAVVGLVRLASGGGKPLRPAAEPQAPNKGEL